MLWVGKNLGGFERPVQHLVGNRRIYFPIKKTGNEFPNYISIMILY
jgi:hypothetical protein